MEYNSKMGFMLIGDQNYRIILEMIDYLIIVDSRANWSILETQSQQEIFSIIEIC